MDTQRLNLRLRKNALDAIFRFVSTTHAVDLRPLILLQTEHIDNPKGYGEGDDPKKYDKRLRGVSNAKVLRLHPH